MKKNSPDIWPKPTYDLVFLNQPILLFWKGILMKMTLV